MPHSLRHRPDHAAAALPSNLSRKAGRSRTGRDAFFVTTPSITWPPPGGTHLLAQPGGRPRHLTLGGIDILVR